MIELIIDAEQYESDAYAIVTEINGRASESQIDLIHRYAKLLYEDYYEEGMAEIKRILMEQITTNLLEASQEYRREHNEILRKL